jgi:hypothetical protein
MVRLTGNPVSAGLLRESWLANARLASVVVIVASNVYIARVLYLLYRHRASELPAPRMVMLFATLIALCGVSHLVPLLGGERPTWVLPTAMKVLSAAFWVAVAVRLPSVVAHLMSPLPVAGSGVCAVADFNLKTKPLRIKGLVLDDMIHNDAWLRDKADAMRELRDFLAELEAEQCRT